MMEKRQSSAFSFRDGLEVLWISVFMAFTAWLLLWMNLVYAPLPMFAASLVTGWVFRGRTSTAALAGGLVGFFGGIPSELAYSAARFSQVPQIWGNEGNSGFYWVGLGELLFYAAFLSFFSAFFCWGIQGKQGTVGVSPSGADPNSGSFESITSETQGAGSIKPVRDPGSPPNSDRNL